MNELIQVKHNDQLILTTEQLATAYGTETNNIKKNYHENKERFIQGKHYYKLEGTELKDFKNQVTQSNLVNNHSSSLMLWTKRGVARHAKILDTDEAWMVYEELEESYFNPKPIQQQLPSYQIENPIERAEKWIEEQKERKILEQQRDEAIRTKAMISDKKTATALGQLGGLTAENNKLKQQLKIIKGYATILAVQKQTGNTYPHGPLKKYCIQNNLIIEKVPDARYTEVNSYPKEAWKAVYNIII